MEILVPYSPLLSELPQQEEITADLLCMSGIAVSVAHMMWLLKELVYFVRNPLPVLSLVVPLRFRTCCADKMYLLRLYRLADFLCMSEEVLNSIALACFECFFLSDKWSPELLNYYPLEKRIQTLWGTFVADYHMCHEEMNTFTEEVPEWTFNMPVKVHTTSFRTYNLGDIDNVFGSQARKVVKVLRRNERDPKEYSLTHYIFPHEHTYAMNAVLQAINKVCYGHGAGYTMKWFVANVETYRTAHQKRQAHIAQAALEGHDISTCDCENCLATHMNCSCRHHYEELTDFDYDYYVEPDWGYMAEIAWERRYGNGW